MPWLIKAILLGLGVARLIEWIKEIFGHPIWAPQIKTWPGRESKMFMNIVFSVLAMVFWGPDGWKEKSRLLCRRERYCYYRSLHLEHAVASTDGLPHLKSRRSCSRNSSKEVMIVEYGMAVMFDPEDDEGPAASLLHFNYEETKKLHPEFGLPRNFKSQRHIEEDGSVVWAWTAETFC